MLSQAPRTTTAAPRSRRASSRLRVLIAAMLLGLLAPLVSVAGTAEAAAVKPRTRNEVTVQKAVLKLLNSQRKAHHLPALKMNAKLQVAARRHNATMARKNTMSHQVRGESSFSRRISAAGYNWSWVGENIAWNSQVSKQGVLTLQKLMYNEKAPYDGHRKNILNKKFREVGIDVYVDKAHHKVWLTTDFGRRR